MVLFLYTKEISPAIGEKQNVIDLKMHSKQCMQLLFLENCLSFILKEIFVCESELWKSVIASVTQVAYLSLKNFTR